MRKIAKVLAGIISVMCFLIGFVLATDPGNAPGQAMSGVGTLLGMLLGVTGLVVLAVAVLF